MHHGRTSAMMGAFKALPAFARATEGVLATAGTFVLRHLRAAGPLAELLRRALAALIGLEWALTTVATRLMVGVWTSHVAGALLAMSVRITTGAFRASGVFIARTRRRRDVSTTTDLGATLRLGAAAIGFAALRIATLRLGAATIGFTALGFRTLGLRIASRGFGAAFGAWGRHVGATCLGSCGCCRGFGSFLSRKRGDADGAEAEQHQTMAGCGFHGLECGC